MEDSFVLQKAASDETKYTNNILSLIIALSGLGAFGSLICLCMTVISAFSRQKFDNIGLIAASFIGMLLCVLVFVVADEMYKQRKKAYLKAQKKLYKKAERIKGRVVGAVKYVRHVKYMRDTFDDIQWCFKIEYGFGDEKKIIESDRYLNDISQVLADDRVYVLMLDGEVIAFEGYKLRCDDREPYVQLNTEEIEQESEV